MVSINLAFWQYLRTPSSIPAAQAMRSQMRVPHFGGWGVASSVKGSSSLWRNERMTWWVGWCWMFHHVPSKNHQKMISRLTFESFDLSWDQLERSRYINDVQTPMLGGFTFKLLCVFSWSLAVLKVTVNISKPFWECCPASKQEWPNQLEN